MARTMFAENKDTKIYRIVLEVVMEDGKSDFWSTVYGPYPQQKTADTQLTRTRKNMDLVMQPKFNNGIISYDAWREDGDITWKRSE